MISHLLLLQVFADRIWVKGTERKLIIEIQQSQTNENGVSIECAR